MTQRQHVTASLLVGNVHPMIIEFGVLLKIYELKVTSQDQQLMLATTITINHDH